MIKSLNNNMIKNFFNNFNNKMMDFKKILKDLLIQIKISKILYQANLIQKIKDLMEITLMMKALIM